MKNLFRTTLIAVISMISLLLSSCSKDSANNEQPQTPNVTISVVSVTDSTVTVNFELTNASSYNCAIGNAADISKFANGTMEGIKKQIPASQKEVTFDNLNSDTEYTIFAQAISDGIASNSIRTKQFTTEQSSDPDLSINILETTVGLNSIAVSITYGADTKSISYAIGQPSDEEAFTNGTLKDIKSVDAPKPPIISVNNLESGKEYTLFLRANTKTVQGPVVSTTGKTILMNLDIKVTPNNKEEGGVKITFTPEGDIEKYYFTVFYPDEIELFEESRNMFGSGLLLGETIITDISEPYEYDFIPYDDTQDWCIYYKMESTQPVYTSVLTYDFSLQ